MMDNIKLNNPEIYVKLSKYNVIIYRSIPCDKTNVIEVILKEKAYILKNGKIPSTADIEGLKKSKYYEQMISEDYEQMISED